MLALVAEDRARFRLPAERVIARVVAPFARRVDEDEAAYLARVRASVTPYADWLSLHRRLPEGREYSLDDLIAEAGVDDPLALALGCTGAAPWFRRKDGRFTAVPALEARRTLRVLNEERFVAAADGAVAAWWPERSSGVPAAWRAAADREAESARWTDTDYRPDEAAAGRDSLDAVIHVALRGECSDGARALALVRSLGLHETPDILLEELVACGALPKDTNPSAERACLFTHCDESHRHEIKSLSDSAVDASGRTDLTGLLAVAVDSAGTFEVDDAVSLRRVDGRLELLVHVADCTRLAKCESLTLRAHWNASSLYIPDGTTPMLFRDAVEALSLGPDPRPALTLVAALSDDLSVVDTRFERTVVRVARHVTYAESRDASVLGENAEDGALLVRIGDALRAARGERGARIVEIPSIDVALRDGVPEVRVRRQDSPADVLVSETMVLYNSAAAALMADARAPALYRTQSGDTDRRRQPPEVGDPLYELRLRKSFAPTVVATEPGPHHGLGVDAYVQITSPIRRYGDMANQGQLCAVLRGEKPPLNHAELEDLATHLAQRVRRVRQAADARLRYWIARVFEPRVGEVLPGLLSRTPRRGTGSVWIPDLHREVTLKCERSWRAPSEGTAGQWRITRVRPWRGRIEVEPIVAEGV